MSINAGDQTNQQQVQKYTHKKNKNLPNLANTDRNTQEGA